MKPSYPLSTLLSLSFFPLLSLSGGSSVLLLLFLFLLLLLRLPLPRRYALFSLLPIRSLTVFSLSFSTLYGAAVSAEQRTGARRAMHSLEGNALRGYKGPQLCWPLLTNKDTRQPSRE